MSVPASQRTQSDSIIKTNVLMWVTEIIAVYSRILQDTYTLCRQNVGLNAREVGTHSYQMT
jgi:hypothetical protein